VPVTTLYWLDQIQPSQRSLVGNKAFHLSELFRKEFPVAQGFVVSAAVVQQFLETIDWLEPLFADLPNSSLHLDVENPQQLQAIAQQIRRSITATALAEELLLEIQQAVEQLRASTLVLRPSLAVISAERSIQSLAWNPIANGTSSALFHSQLCFPTTAGIAAALKQIWAELFSAKSLFYWQRSDIPLHQIRLAVLVQPIQSAIAAGTVQVDGDFFEVRSAPGLGMVISWGDVVPDLYRIWAETGEIQMRHLGNKTIAYRLATQDDDTSNCSAGAGVPFFPLLQPYLLDNAQQAQYSLDTPHLQQLIQLTRSVVKQFGIPLELEWVLHMDDDLQPQLDLTQILFPQKPTPHQGMERAGRYEAELAVSRIKRDAFAPDAEVKIESPTNLELVATGLAASPGQAIAKAIVIPHSTQAIEPIEPGTVLVATELLPHWLPIMKQATAVVAELGGMTSHAAIIARELQIPAVMATVDATRQIRTGDRVLVDGNQGKVYQVTDGATRHRTAAIAESSEDVEPLPDRPPIATQLMVNLSQPESLDRITRLPIDGIGLLRAELLAIATLDFYHPHHWLQQERQAEFVARMTDQLCQFATAMGSRPVFYRSFDLRSHEFRGLLGGETIQPEANPMLGLRGTFSYTLDPTLFDLELAVLKQVQQMGHRNVHLLLPFVRTVEEFRFCRQRVEQAGLLQNPLFQLWIMAEVPSVLFLLPDYVKAGVQGISIGTNDLTQLLFGVDRDQSQMTRAFDERHPAVMAAIAHLIQNARQQDIPCSICGQAPVHYPEVIDALVRLGITSISVEPDAIKQTHHAIARAERRLLLDTVR